MSFSRKDEKWPGERLGFTLDASGEAESLNYWWLFSPADETGQSTLPESGIVFADSVPDVGMNA